MQLPLARLALGQTVARLLNNRPAPDWATRSGRPWTPANLAKVARTTDIARPAAVAR